jgi:hypothetical protein
MVNICLKKTLLKQDVIIMGMSIKSPKLNMALSGIGLTFIRNGLGVGIVTVFEMFGPFQGNGTTT